MESLSRQQELFFLFLFLPALRLYILFINIETLTSLNFARLHDTGPQLFRRLVSTSPSLPIASFLKVLSLAPSRLYYYKNAADGNILSTGFSL